MPVINLQISSTQMFVIWIIRLVVNASTLTKARKFLLVNLRITILANNAPKIPPTGIAPVSTGRVLLLLIIRGP